jgi:hypothetical protein
MSAVIEIAIYIGIAIIISIGLFVAYIAYAIVKALFHVNKKIKEAESDDDVKDELVDGVKKYHANRLLNPKYGCCGGTKDEKK